MEKHGKNSPFYGKIKSRLEVLRRDVPGCDYQSENLLFLKFEWRVPMQSNKRLCRKNSK